MEVIFISLLYVGINNSIRLLSAISLVAIIVYGFGLGILLWDLINEIRTKKDG